MLLGIYCALQVAAYDTVAKKMAFFEPSRAQDFLFISGTKVRFRCSLLGIQTVRKILEAFPPFSLFCKIQEMWNHLLRLTLRHLKS